MKFKDCNWWQKILYFPFKFVYFCIGFYEGFTGKGKGK